MMLVQTLASMAALSLPAIAPAVGKTLGRSTALIGYQISLVYAGAMVTSLLGGTAVRRWGACRVSQASLSLSAVGMLLITIPSLFSIVLASVIIGLGYGLTNPSASHLLSQVTNATNRNAIFSIKQTAVPLGGVAAGLLLPHLAITIGWQTGLILVAFVTIAMLAVIHPLRARWDADRDPGVELMHTPFDGFAVVWDHAPLRWLALSAFCFAMIQLCLAAFSPSMLVKDLGLGLTQAGMILALIQIAGCIGRLVWGWTADRLHNGLVVLMAIAAASLISALAVGTMDVAWPTAGVSLLMMGFGLTAAGWNGIFLAAVARLSPPEKVGTATGGALFFTFGGVLCGPPLFAILYGVIGTYTVTYQLLAVVAAAGIGCVARARRLSR